MPKDGGFVGLWGQQYYSYIVTVSFIGGGNWSTQRKPPTCRKSKTDSHNIIPEALKSLYRSPGYKKNQLVLCKNYVLQW
jgi:hypothetical protein